MAASQNETVKRNNTEQSAQKNPSQIGVFHWATLGHQHAAANVQTGDHGRVPVTTAGRLLPSCF
jgi:hypothetical protein